MPEGRPVEDGRDLEEVERRLLAFLHDELLAPGLRVERDTDLLSGEILDSMSMVRLGAFVEEDLGVALRPEDFVVERFRSVATIVDLVRSSETVADGAGG